MAILVVPITAALLAMSYPLMKVAAFGHATRAGGVGLLAASLASLAIGLYPYSAFLLFARAYYALGNSRTPALVAVASAVIGVAVTATGALTSGTGTVALLGAGNTAAFLVGALVLGVGLARRTGQSLIPPALVRSVLVAAPIGLAAWLVFRAIDPAGRVGNLAMLVVVTAVGGSAYLLGVRALGGGPGPAPLRVA
jgi:putative peptidoglycan lipid II flippase